MSAWSIGLVVLLIVVVSLGLTVWHWEALSGDESVSETIRNIGLVIGGLIAIVLGAWRGAQAQKQVELAEHDSLDGQFQKCAEMLGHEHESVRTSGVISLSHLAANHPARYYVQATEILRSFFEERRVDRDARFEGRLVEVGRRGHRRVYRGTPDGGEAFNRYHDLQEHYSYSPPLSLIQRWNRVKARLRRGHYSI